VLRVLVGVAGRPVQVEVEKSSRSRLLDRAAIDAVRNWVFNPGQRDGKPVQGWVLVPISFKLTDL
jgi:protein TonB